MTDYGHELTFGTFITPRSERPAEVVALAQLSERAGLDLVTFQDHPYQPAFLDTWTLLSWVAAQTDTVHLAANVLNLPLRHPAVVARAAASLDLLSGGRVELGLGAGAFWDAIEAMGGPRRTPGQSVDALSEAIDVIRAIWNPAERRGVNVPGEHYRVRGAKRGPEPAHDISIWLGALKPRMLRLIGAKADGWIPSLAYLQDGDLARGNRIIDDAAQAAGRDPREVRRLLNISGPQGPPEQWVEELLPFVLEHGVSTFILMADEPRTIEVWGGEVAPALRDAVARERTEVVRHPKARRDGSRSWTAAASGSARARAGATWRALAPHGLAISSGASEAVTRPLAEAEATSAAWLSIRSVGGVVNDVDPAATAYAHRHQNVNVSSVGGSDAFLGHWDDLRPLLDGLHLSFETDPRPERLHDAFPGETLTKLRELKARYDPENVFDQNFPIQAPQFVP